MSFVLPTMSASERARRDSQNAYASTSQAQLGATSTVASGFNAGSGEATRRTAGPNKGRRKGKGKGRMMMIKIFYALSSPRFGWSGSTPTPSSGPTPEFLAVLDPSLAPSPQPVTPSNSSGPQEPTYSCMARLSAPVWVQVMNGKSIVEGGDERQQFGRVTLKTCLSAICISRPELVIDATKDFSVSAVDPYESSHQRQPPAGNGFAASSSSRAGEGLVEGKGMLSWTLAEKKEGTTMVCGKIAGMDASDTRRSKRRKGEDGMTFGGDEGEDDEDESGDESEETLEIWLQLTERDAFTQGQFLDCLRSYHNPVQHLQSEISDFNSSPPKPRADSSGALASSSSFGLRSTGPTGDPIKKKRPRESLPLAIPPTAIVPPPQPFVAASSPAIPPDVVSANPALQDPRILALLGQLVPSLNTNSSSNSPRPALSFDSPQGQALLPAIRTLAQFYGLDLPAAAPAAQQAAPSSMPPSSSVAGPSSHSHQPARPPLGIPGASSGSGKAAKRKEREHFATIDPNTLTIPPQGKQNPRDPTNGCSNCKRRKSTVWREGTGPDGMVTSVCNACGTFFNKNGYHRSKGNTDAQATNRSQSHAPPPSSTAAAMPVKATRPLKGRLTATCEADLNKHKSKPRKSGSPVERHAAGIIPPLSPSKQIGPRSPSRSFTLSQGARSAGRALGGIMSSPGRSPRMKYRQTSNPFSATSPVRGSSSNAGLDVSYESDGEERGPNPLSYPNLFGNLTGSPSPVRVSPGAVGGKVPSYLLTASPGTALDRILNDTNISLSGVLGSGGSSATAAARDAMQLESHAPIEGGFADFNFFLAPGSPSLGKENARPPEELPPPSTTDAPTTDFDSFESVLSSLRRDFSTRLSSNALTAPSSPAPSSPCLLPRTGTTPGSKGKVPMSSGRAAPSILDSFIDGLVPAYALDASAEGEQGTLNSEGWSPLDEGEQTLTFDTTTASGPRRSPRRHGASQSFDLSQHTSFGGTEGTTTSKASGSTRRAAFVPAHLLPSDAATEFDFGSLPPSSPPQLPSEAFPTPSDYGVTPSADGGDVEERDRPLTIEAVAEKVATEPNEDARKAMLALLQSLGAGEVGMDGGAIGSGKDAVQLDRSTVNKLLALISANPASSATTSSATTSSATSSSATAAPFATGSQGLTASASTSTIVPKANQPDFSHLDIFKSFEPEGFEQDGSQSQSGQVGDLFDNLFGGNSGF